MRRAERIVTAIVATAVAVAAVTSAVWPESHTSKTTEPGAQSAGSASPDTGPITQQQENASDASLTTGDTTRARGEQPEAVSRAGPRKPTIVRRTIPFPQQRKDEMAVYSKRHYGQAAYRLTKPKVIVEHFTANDSVQATYNTFAPDQPDVELHELPGVCSHFVIARDGTIVQLVPLGLRCRHTVGLNWTAIGIEHVGFSDSEILNNARQIRASLRLTSWLHCRYEIAVKNVIGHNESLTSPYHHERVARLRNQTHEDWARADMAIYRAKLRKRQACV